MGKHWTNSNDPDELLVLLHDRASERKMRLFCCACIRRIWSKLRDAPECRRTIEIVEHYADERSSLDELREAASQAEASIHTSRTEAKANARRAVAWSAQDSVNALGVCRSVAWAAAYAFPRKQEAERLAQLHLLRDIFQDTLEQNFPKTSILSEVAIDLCRSIYFDRKLSSGNFVASRIALLTDTLRNAGVADSSIIRHLGEAGPHVRGCWVVDMILGLE